MTDFLHCPSCNMTFKSSLLLEKHRDKFCIGRDPGRAKETHTPQDMINRLRKQRRNGDEHIKETNNYKTTPSNHADSNGKSDYEKTNGHSKQELAADNETQLRYLSEAHSKQINDILSQNKLLEKQRDDIVQRLNEISAESRNTGYLEKMIRHLNTQEQKNEQLLTAMKQQIDLLQTESMKREMLSRHGKSSALHKVERSPVAFQRPFVPVYGGGPLSSEISALRLTYLQNGGSDRMILAHLQDLLVEAQLIEQKEKHGRPLRKKNKKEHDATKWHLNDKLITLEMENQQLEDELFRLQLRRHKSNRIPKTTPGDLDKSLQLSRFMKPPTRQNIKALNAELAVLKQDLEIQKLKRRFETSHKVRPQLNTVLPLEKIKPHSANLTKHYLNFSHGLEPAPYDPIAGFVIFYDFLLGLEPSYRVCRLAVSLCNGMQEMGNASVLPPVYCEAASSMFHDNKRQHLAILAAKQQVPRIRPSPNMSLIIELQASGGYDPYGQEVSRLIPRGWVKLDIFDYQNRVISGHWKVPIRILPVKPSLSTGALNGVPQLESAELYVRIVNARDASVQSAHPIDTSNAVFYKYPPLSAAYFQPEEVILPSSYHSSQYFFPNMQPIYGENVDSPPSRHTLTAQGVE